jgi:hypothetical protein
MPVSLELLIFNKLKHRCIEPSAATCEVLSYGANVTDGTLELRRNKFGIKFLKWKLRDQENTTQIACFYSYSD